MKLEEYISELLYQYDCVIVPGLGGFIANYKSATIQPIQNTFSPPSKSISFNKNLKNNDGLLANLIAQKEEISFDAATKNIEDCIVKINRDLKLKKTVLFQNVGTLFLDAENRTQFEPQNTANYLLGSYGLSVFQKQPIKRVSIEEKITREFKDKAIPLAVMNDKKGVNPKWRAAAIIVPLAFLAVWMPTQYNLGGDLNYATLNPFKSEKNRVYTSKKRNFAFNDITRSTVKDKINAADKNTYFLPVVFDNNKAPIIVQLREKPIAEAISTDVATSKRQPQYHIIGGCFSTKAYAKKMVRTLKRKGFDADIVGKRKGLWTVSYGSFVTRKEAINVLAAAKGHNSKAWILKQSF